MVRLSRQARKQGVDAGRCLTVATFAFAFLVILCMMGLFRFLGDMHPTSVQMGKKSSKLTGQPKPAAKSQLDKKDPSSSKKVLVLDLEGHGPLRIVLRPDWSKESVETIEQLVEKGCQRCKFYRAEKPGIFQGIMASPSVPITANKGPCPPELQSVANDCPEHDPKCACHGPLMKKGMVGWAGGATGPDFFIDHYERTADWWGTTHTAFGILEDEASHELVNRIWELPAAKQGSMTFLKKEIHFTMSIEAVA